MVAIAPVKEYSALSRREQYIWEDELCISRNLYNGTSTMATITLYCNCMTSLDQALLEGRLCSQNSLDQVLSRVTVNVC